jgi:hypothetical protein
VKSNLFKKEFIPGKDFKNDVAAFAKLSADQLSVIADWILDTTHDLQQIPTADILELSEKTEVSAENISSVLGLSRFLLLQSRRLEDNFHDILDDIIELGLIERDKRPTLLEFFNRIAAKSLPLSDEIKKRTYEVGAAPLLFAEAHVVDLRLVLEDKYNLDDDIEGYQPEAAALIPTATIRLVIDDREVKTPVNFQVNFEGLEKLVNALQACQKELRLLQKIQQSIDLRKGEAPVEG